MVEKPIHFKYVGDTVRGAEFRAENKRGIMVLPERFSAYMLFINLDSKYPKVRNMLLKPLLTLAETIARF